MIPRPKTARLGNEASKNTKVLRDTPISSHRNALKILQTYPYGRQTHDPCALVGHVSKYSLDTTKSISSAVCQMTPIASTHISACFQLNCWSPRSGSKCLRHSSSRPSWDGLHDEVISSIVSAETVIRLIAAFSIYHSMVCQPVIGASNA